MGLDKITIKLQEALQGAQRLASTSDHAELKSEHLLLGLLQQKEGLAIPSLEKAGANLTALKANLITALDKEPRVQGASTQPHLGNDLKSTLDVADEIRSEMADEFLSVEHVLLGAMRVRGAVGKLMLEAGVTPEALERPSVKSEGARQSRMRIQRVNIRPLRSMGQISVALLEKEESIQLLEEILKSAGLCRCFHAGRKTIQC